MATESHYQVTVPSSPTGQISKRTTTSRTFTSCSQAPGMQVPPVLLRPANTVVVCVEQAPVTLLTALFLEA